MREVVLLVIAAAISVSVFAAQDGDVVGAADGPSQYSKVPPRDGEFRFSSRPGLEGIACTVVIPPGGTSPSLDQGYIPCLRLGQYRLGMQFSALQATLSKVYGVQKKYVENPRLMGRTEGGISTAVIPLAAAPTGDPPPMSSYLVVMYNAAGTVGSLQVTGLGGVPAIFMPFSSIVLGSPKQQVLDILGFPSGVADVPDIRGQLWSYAPFPFTLEFVNDVVYSVRIELPSPQDIGRAFVPLKSLP